MNHNNSFSIAQSLLGKNILVTGVTGFLGKVVVEKLLREVPEIGGITLLIRGSKKLSAGRRLQQEVFDVPLFDSLKTVYGAEFQDYINKKVRLLEGDLTEHYFGLSALRFEQLAESVDLIINSAASVDFREPLDKALQTNTLSLNNIIAAARRPSGRTVPVLHVSTCYVNGFNKGLIKEEIAGPAKGNIPPLCESSYQITHLLDRLELKIDAIRKRYSNLKEQREELIKLGIQEAVSYGWNDTYTFTKWLGEQILIRDLAKKNLTIVRPSIIESAVQFPKPGWVEGIKVADALIYAYAKKRLSVFPGDPDSILDVIPVDLVANAVIIAAAEVCIKPPQLRIYQCCSGRSNPISLSRFADYIEQEARQNFASYPKLFAGNKVSRARIISPQRLELYLKALARLVYYKGLIRKLLGSKKVGKTVKKVSTTAELAKIYGYYCAADYRFDSTKLEQLATYLEPEERDRYVIRADSYQWQHYLQEIHMPGLHRYALDKRPTTPLPQPSRIEEAAPIYKVA
ncbi:SDR family oxidoreductase [Amphritea sp. HPY]|uniref:SDR family oxidoreductase n=1 Tax=Amphritea sp. HPY TaxID=3421652 RepID=UPI003D7EB9BB